jgi:ABC-2 type transport system permease protein
MRTVSEIGLILGYQLRVQLRQPLWVVITLVQPLLYLCLFGPLLKPLAATIGGANEDPWGVYVPGLLVQLTMVSTLFVGFGLLTDLRTGVLERLVVAPVSRVALLLGRVLRDCITLVAQSVALLLVATALGLRATPAGVAFLVANVALLGVALAAVSYSIALAVKHEDGFAQLLNAAFVPVLLLSGILLPMSLAPPWLRWLSSLDPLRHIVDGARAAALGHLSESSCWAGLGMAMALAALGVFVGARAYEGQSR